MPSTLRQRSTLLALVTGAALLLGACGSGEQPPAAAAPATTPAPATAVPKAATEPAAGGGATSGGGTTAAAKVKVKGDAEGAVTALLGAWKHEDEELAYGYGTQGAVGSLFAQPTPSYVALLGCTGNGKDEVTCEATTGGPSSGTRATSAASPSGSACCPTATPATPSGP